MNSNESHWSLAEEEIFLQIYCRGCFGLCTPLCFVTKFKIKSNILSLYEQPNWALICSFHILWKISTIQFCFKQIDVCISFSVVLTHTPNYQLRHFTIYNHYKFNRLVNGNYIITINGLYNFYTQKSSVVVNKTFISRNRGH